MAPQLINGPAGPLEILFEQAENPVATAPVVVIAHPHSLYGGSMTNKVVHMLAKLALSLGMTAIRFNFRGVGQSAGNFSHGVGEQADLLAVVDWVRQQNPMAPVWLAGFSFGSFVAYTSYFLDPAISRLTLVAPPVRMFEFAQNQTVSIPWSVVQGKNDEITDYHAVEDWVKQHPSPPDFHLLDGVDHFFNGKLNLLDATLRPFWSAPTK